MPTLLRWNGWRFFFYSGDEKEPPHVHVVKDDAEIKIWLHDVSVAKVYGMNAKNINQIIRKVRENKEQFMEAWHGYFG